MYVQLNINYKSSVAKNRYCDFKLKFIQSKDPDERIGDTSQFIDLCRTKNYYLLLFT